MPEPVFMSMIYRIVVMYVLFGICRLLFVLFNFRYFSISGPAHLFQWLWGGLVFDTVAILYVNILYIVLATIPVPFRYKKWYEAILSVLFVVTNSIAIAANLADIFYYPFTLTRTTASVFRQLSNESNLGKLFSKFLVDYWYGTLIFIVVVAGLVYFAKKTRPDKTSCTVRILLLWVCPYFNASHLYPFHRRSEGWI